MIPAEATLAVQAARRCLGASLVAGYLHGSAVAGGLRATSDVDVLVVVDRPTTPAARQRLVREMMRVSGRPGSGDGARPLELIVLRLGDLAAAAAYPRRCEFIYGEWLRPALEAGAVPEPGCDPELSVLLAQARGTARTLVGPAPAALLPIVPEDELRRAIGDSLPRLLATLHGDERNVLLTLVRMWRTLTTGEIVAKDVAAAWAIPRLPRRAARLVGYASDGYTGALDDDWRGRRRDAAEVANGLRDRVAAML